jgi:phosphatidylglycerophosphate synthase
LIVAAEAVHGAADGGEATNEPRLLVLVVLLATGASDMLDGWLARRSGAEP